MNTEVVKSYLDAYRNNRLSVNTNVLSKKGQSRFHLLRSAVFYVVQDYGLKKASSVKGCPLDPLEVVRERRLMAELSSLIENMSHPMQDTLTALDRSFSDRLLHPEWRKDTGCPSLLLLSSLTINTVPNTLLTPKLTNLLVHHQCILYCAISIFWVCLLIYLTYVVPI